MYLQSVIVYLYFLPGLVYRLNFLRKVGVIGYELQRMWKEAPWNKLRCCPISAVVLDDWKNENTPVWLEVLTAACIKMAVCWVVAPCVLVYVYQCFRDLYSFHHQGHEITYRPDGEGCTDILHYGTLIAV
jgi:peptidoglycan/xylan/chitin deacetylase (PgdA/CDA1 family)